MTSPRERDFEECGRQSAPGADPRHTESAATSSPQEKGASNLPDSCKDVRDAKRRETEWKKIVRKQRVPSWGGKMGAPMGTRLNRREGRARGTTPLHMAKARSDTRRLERAVDERACTSGSTAREGRHRTKPLVPEAGPGGTNCAVMADFGQNRLWPNRLWPNRVRLCVFVCVCVCLCVLCCGVGVGFTVSVPREPPFPGPPFPHFPTTRPSPGRFPLGCLRHGLQPRGHLAPPPSRAHLCRVHRH